MPSHHIIEQAADIISELSFTDLCDDHLCNELTQTISATLNQRVASMVDETDSTFIQSLAEDIDDLQAKIVSALEEVESTFDSDNMSDSAIDILIPSNIALSDLLTGLVTSEMENSGDDDVIADVIKSINTGMSSVYDAISDLRDHLDNDDDDSMDDA